LNEIRNYHSPLGGRKVTPHHRGEKNRQKPAKRGNGDCRSKKEAGNQRSNTEIRVKNMTRTLLHNKRFNKIRSHWT